MSDEKTTVRADGHVYRWHEPWAGDEGHEDGPEGFAHHGIVITSAGEAVTFHNARSEVRFYDLDGNFLRSWPVDAVEGHGLTLVEEGGQEFLWIADIDSNNVRQDDGSFADVARSAHPKQRGAAVKYSLDGVEVLRLAVPHLEPYNELAFSPTDVAVDEERFGGSGDIWVADGYGPWSCVHRFTKEGEHLATLTGEEGGGRFSCPHAIVIDRRHDEPELYVADRGNHRIQVYDLAGVYRRTVGEEFLNSPSAFALYGEYLVVAELFARLALLDNEDRLVGYLGEGPDLRERPGWPNALTEDEKKVRPPLEPGKFNTPHGLAVDADGNLYVAEWLIGGRTVKLEAVEN